MSVVNDGGPAFPVPLTFRPSDGQPMSTGELWDGGNGMSLRAYFAGQALAGMYANPAIVDTFSAHETMATEACAAADSLLRKLNKPPES